MNLSLHLAPQVRAFGKAARRQFTMAEVETIETTMNSVASLDDAGQVRFDLGAGPVGSLDDALAMMSIGMGAPTSPETSTHASSIPAGSNHTARAVALNQAAKAGSDALKRQQAETVAATWGNPWRTGNATHRAFITNAHPTLASRLRREAGVSAS